MKTVSSEYINTKFNNKEDYRREDERLDGEIFRIADDIALRCKDKPIVLLSGPSGSGKTTTAHKISRYLDEKGHKTHVISLDNYFKTILPDGQDEVDFESPSRIDSKMLSEHIKKISECKEIELPMFDFLSKKSVSSGIKLKRKKGEVVLFEGIHALNPLLTKDIPQEAKFKIYASALTSILLDDHNYIPTTDNRLLRRIVRDYKYRGYSAEETIRRWPSVRAGEEKWIFPFQEEADVMINTALLFELAALRSQALPLLEQVPENVPEYSEAYRLRKFLHYLKPISTDGLPPTSLLREFLGGSTFKY